jgi:hypothetical protein
VQTDATRTCELLVGLRDVTVLGVDERLRQPFEVCVDPQHPGSIALSCSLDEQSSMAVHSVPDVFIVGPCPGR